MKDAGQKGQKQMGIQRRGSTESFPCGTVGVAQ